jgi:hypothetical protein
MKQFTEAGREPHEPVAEAERVQTVSDGGKGQQVAQIPSPEHEL